MTNFPKYKDLPFFVVGQPQRKAWHVFGQEDELGTLNHLTPQTALIAAKEIQTGESYSLNWALEMPDPPLFGRAAGGVKVKDFSQQGFPLANDNIYLDMNTQASTQWDGLLHLGNTKAGTFYNGVKGPNAEGHLGIHHMARRGITARAILLDWKAYADANNIQYDYRTYKVTLQDLKNVIAADKIAIQPGDILMIRTGWIEWYETADEATRKELASTHAPPCLGVDPSEDILEWIWDSRFAAVSADCPSFEVYPPTTRFIHEDLLGSFGCPIGEFFDLQRLASV